MLSTTHFGLCGIIFIMKSLFIISCSLLLAGCATTSMMTYPYRAVTNDCNCEEFHTTSGKIAYTYRAYYRMRDGLLTTIEIGIENKNNDTLSLELAHVKVSSRNIPYQYNDKFLPLPPLRIPRGHSENIQLEGKSLDTNDDWNKIAGEQMTVTMQGMRLGDKVLPATSVVFVPFNPRMER